MTEEEKKRRRLAKDKKVTVAEARGGVEGLSPERRAEIQQVRAVEDIRQREKLASQTGQLSRTAGRQLVPQREVELAEALTPPPEAVSQEVVTQAEEASTALEEQRVNQPDISPDTGLPFLETPEEAEKLQKKQRDFASKLVTGKATKEEIIEEAKNLVVGGAIAGSAIGFIAASPALTAGFAAAAVKASSATGILSTAIGGATSYFIGKNVLDYKSGELDNVRGSLAKYTEDGEKMQALVLQGASPELELQIMLQYVEEINEAEAGIQAIGNDNVQFRYEKEWRDDMQTIRTARTAVQRRIDAVLQIIATGAANLPGEELIREVATI